MISAEQDVILQLDEPLPPKAGEDWARYRVRVEERLESVLQAADRINLSLQPLLAANALYGRATGDQSGEIRRGALGRSVRTVAWNPDLKDALAMEAAGRMAAAFRSSPVALRGRGVRVAVLDSGIDLRHPWLTVADSASTCPESWEVPGRHGTFCAGVIAARHHQYAGLAPDADLLNVKIARADGRTSPVSLARGMDEALDRRADVLSISFGLNQIWHGWLCPEGDCILCRAVDNAVRCGAVVVAAAGNLHGVEVAGEPLRTELLCPGQARAAITVGATERDSAKVCSFSSRGPTAYGLRKPDLVAVGEDLISTVPVSPGCEDSFLQFSAGSGTSVATAKVAGAVALLIERKRRGGEAWTPEEIREELLTRCVRRLPGESMEAAGAGCLVLTRNADTDLPLARPPDRQLGAKPEGAGRAGDPQVRASPGRQGKRE